MRQIVPIIAAAAIIGASIGATVVKAEDTTVIKKNNDTGSKTIIKKRDNDVNVPPASNSEGKETIIKKENQ
jgi:hypothetical protein